MNSQAFDKSYQGAVDLHRAGQTQKALETIEQLLESDLDQGQRQTCENEKKNLSGHIEGMGWVVGDVA